MNESIRVAAAQFHVGDHVDQNLATCLRMIGAATDCRPELLVLPEFANHCSWYDDADHCLAVAVSLDGPFLADIAQAARDLSAYVVINCTLARPGDRVTGTSLMYSPEGELLGEADKQVLIGHENDFLDRATRPGPVMETPLGRLAMYSCMDGVINETPRCLALRGAQVLCNSLNSFAVDEGTLHIPVRAAENKVWVVAANKVGPLIPDAMVEPVSQAINIPPHFLEGAGDSQIVSPDGRVLALAGKSEELVFADIEVNQADNKRRPDQSRIFFNRRPDLYRPLCADPQTQPIPDIQGPESLVCAAIPLTATEPELIRQRVGQAVDQGARLIVLPELFGVASSPDVPDLNADELIDTLTSVCGDEALVACSLPMPSTDGITHSALLIGENGIVLNQPQLHQTNRHSWAALGPSLSSVETRFGRLGVLAGEDAIYPEVFRLLAIQGVHTVLVPSAFQEQWEFATGLVERAAENRVNIIASSAAGDCTGLVATLQKDFTIMTPWKDREFDGLLSAPEVVRNQSSDTLLGTVHPLAASNKVCSQSTHLVASRPWQLLDPLSTASSD